MRVMMVAMQQQMASMANIINNASLRASIGTAREGVGAANMAAPSNSVDGAAAPADRDPKVSGSAVGKAMPDPRHSEPERNAGVSVDGGSVDPGSGDNWWSPDHTDPKPSEPKGRNREAPVDLTGNDGSQANTNGKDTDRKQRAKKPKKTSSTSSAAQESRHARADGAGPKKPAQVNKARTGRHRKTGTAGKSSQRATLHIQKKPCSRYCPSEMVRILC